MSQVDTNACTCRLPAGTDKDVLSETTVERGDVEGLISASAVEPKLVPVAESIRYRKRAQSAEKEVESLAQELVKARSETAKMAEQLKDMQMGQKLMAKLAAAGTIDLEAAVLVAGSRMQGLAEADLDGVVEQLKKDKQYLFGNSGDKSAIHKADKIALNPPKTSGVKDRTASGQTILERAAKKVATTGSRADLQEYLKLRRNFL